MNEECKKIIKKYNFDYITDNEYEKIISELLKINNNQYTKEFYITFENIIVSRISKMNKLNEYINNKLDDNNNILDQLKNICTYLNNNEINIDNELINILINIDKINDLLSSIIDDNIHLIKKNQFEKISSDNNVVLFMKIYCDIIGIQYNNNYDFYEEDNLKLYLQEISTIPLLTIDEERSLAYKIKNGDESAKEKFINSNLRLVVSIAKRYSGQGLPLLDLIEEGNIGLMIAVNRFDVTKGYKFSTYATHWIYQKILIALSNQSRIIRLPVYMDIKFRDVIKYKQQCKKNGYTPTIYELSKKFNLSLEILQILYYEEEGILSLNHTIKNSDSEDSDTTLENFIKSDKNVEEDYEKNALIEEVRLAIENCNLNDNQRYIIKNYFGIDTTPKNLSQIAKSLNITRERVRQVKKQALTKMSRSRCFVQLENYCDDNKIKRR